MQESKQTKTSEFAQASIIMAVASFIQLFGIEKALISIIFAFMALKSIKNHNLAGKRIAYLAAIIAFIYIVLVSYVIFVHLGDIKSLINSMQKAK